MFTFTIFRASSLDNALQYFQGILFQGGWDAISNYWELGLTTRQDQILLFAGIAVLILVDLLQERGVRLLDRLAAAPRAVRWIAYEGMIFSFLYMGQFLGGGGFLYARY